MSDKKVVSLLKSPRIDIEALRHELDALDHRSRVALLPEFTRTRQRRLYSAADGQQVTLKDMVPDDRGPLEEVIHHGVNTLVGFRSFQKRFCIPSITRDQDDGLLWGYNHQNFSGFTGPGYFVSYAAESGSEYWIDYRQIPPERPSTWPKIIKNEKKLGRFVYSGTVDKMRQVSEHVTIGRAYKDNKALPAWFVLVRQP